MSIEIEITAALDAGTGLSTVPAYPDQAPANAVAPYIVYTQYAGTRIKNLDGDAGLGNPRFQFDIYSKTKAQVSALKDFVRKAIQEADALSAVFQNDGSGYEVETKLYRHRMDFSMWHND